MIEEKLFKLQSEISRLKKDKQNPHFKNSYVDINSVLDEVIPQLHELKILLVQPTTVIEGRNHLITKLIDMDEGSNIEESMILQDGLNAQQTGSALTYYRRYMLITLLSLQTVDDDGKVGSNPVKEKAKPTEEMILEIESLMNGDANFKTQWLNFIGVQKFDDANFGQIEKAIKQLRDKK